MNWLLRTLLGLGPDQFGQGDWSLELGLTGDGIVLSLLGLIAAIIALVWLYRFEAPRLSNQRRSAMIAMRLCVIIALLLMLADPAAVHFRTQTSPSRLLVLVDDSASMDITDLPRKGGSDSDQGLTSRRQRVDDAVTLDWLASLAGEPGQRQVLVHRFAEALGQGLTLDQLQPPQPVVDGAPVRPAWPSDRPLSGRSTALGQAIEQALASNRHESLAGVVVVGDGQSTSGPPPAATARLASEMGVPIHTVAVGTDTGPRNITLQSMQVDPIVYVKDVGRINLAVTGRAVADEPATVILDRRVGQGPWIEVARRDLVMGPDGQQQEVAFSFAEPAPVEMSFRARVDIDGPELAEDDNAAVRQVRIVRQNLRVLLIAGSTFPEVQFLRNTLLRDRRIELSSWLMTADSDYKHPGDVPIKRLPINASELDAYDAVVMYDPDPTLWPPGFGDMLVDFVGQRGGGLVYIAGEHHTKNSFERQTDPTMTWLRLLPVVREPGLFRSRVQIRLSREQAWRLRMTDAGTRSSVLAFDDDPQTNKRVIANLPGMYWHFPVTRAKAGATVLAVHGDPRMNNDYGPAVIMATHLFGPGRVMFLGFDSTYRWRYLDEQLFDGFWARVIDQAGRNKQLGGVHPFRLSSDRQTYEPGQTMTVRATFTDPESVDAGLTALPGQLEASTGQIRPIELEPTEKPGVFETQVTLDEPGDWLVQIAAGSQALDGLARPAVLRVKVVRPELEYANPAADRATLRLLSRTTGGQMFETGRIADVAGALTIGQVSRTIEERQSVWNAPILVLMILGGLIGEWIVRKFNRLI